MKSSLHTWTWVAWLGSALVAISITRNFFYLLLILLCLLVVHYVIAGATPGNAYPFSLLRFGFLIGGFSTLFNLLVSHVGETVLFSLPKSWPLVGGNYTLEAATYGLLNGLILFNILVAFAVFSQALPVRSLIRLIPRAFFPVAVVASIAITFIPTTIRQFQQVKEAQLIRGQRMKSIGDWLPLGMALLVGGLERALQLSEAMTARGFASAEAGQSRKFSRLGMVGGLILATLGWILHSRPGWENWGLGIILLGALWLFGALRWAGRQIRRTTYWREKWRFGDALVLLGMGIFGLALFFPFAAVARNTLNYSVYPLFQWPYFDPWMGTACLALSLPAYVIGLRKE